MNWNFVCVWSWPSYLSLHILTCLIRWYNLPSLYNIGLLWNWKRNIFIYECICIYRQGNDPSYIANTVNALITTVINVSIAQKVTRERCSQSKIEGPFYFQWLTEKEFWSKMKEKFLKGKLETWKNAVIDKEGREIEGNEAKTKRTVRSSKGWREKSRTSDQLLCNQNESESVPRTALRPLTRWAIFLFLTDGKFSFSWATILFFLWFLAWVKVLASGSWKDCNYEEIQSPHSCFPVRISMEPQLLSPSLSFLSVSHCFLVICSILFLLCHPELRAASLKNTNNSWWCSPEIGKNNLVRWRPGYKFIPLHISSLIISLLW